MPARGRRRGLRRDGPRLAISEWQLFDRSFETMLATLDDPGADLPAYATAFDRLADGARRSPTLCTTATSMPRSRRAQFCGTRSPQVRRLIAGPDVLICDECVSTCVTVLEDELGPDRRERHDSD
jgi:hypothetical protein